MGEDLRIEAQRRGEIPREHHYCPETGESQHWQFNSLVGWILLDDKYPDWGRDEYSYFSWDGTIPDAKKGQPPRIWV